ncbi:MAG: carboxypeptidase-like regulatory domain-containing protein [Gemmatimonadales bacterium]
MSGRALSLMGVTIAFAAVACSEGGGTGAKVPPTLAVVSGDSQSGEIELPLGQPLVVSVTAASGDPEPNVTVTWAVAAGGGLLSAPATSTGVDGQAFVTYTLGASSGENRVTASVSDAVGSPVTFRLTALRRGEIETYVFDDAGDPIPFVTVRLRTQGGGVDLDTDVTGATGRVSFLDLTGGAYDVLIDVPPAYTLDGQPNPVGATVFPGETTVATFGLVRIFPTVRD